MKKPLHFFRNFEGTIMIFSLVIILGGTLVLAGWAQMMATRATYTAMTDEGQKRRIALANGRALARQYILNQMPASSNLPGTNYSLAGGWGGFDLQTTANPWANTNFSTGNPFNPISGVSFVSIIPGHISNSVESLGWTFLVRSRSPLLAGFPVVIHAPTDPTASGFNWVTNLAVIYSNKVMTKRPSNPTAPVIPFTSGTNSSGAGTNGYIGYFATPLNTNYTYVDASGLSLTNGSTNGATFVSITTNTNGFTTNYSGGNVTLVLNSSQTNTITRYIVPNTVTNVWTGYSNKSGPTIYLRNYSNSVVTNLMLVGSTNTNALHLIADSSNTNLSTLTLSGTTNTRMIYLNKVGGSLIVTNQTTNNTYTWWLGMTLSTCPATFYAPTGTNKLNIQGGIRSDRTVNVNQGNLSVTTNSAPAISGTNLSPIETIADRILWLEEQRTTP